MYEHLLQVKWRFKGMRDERIEKPLLLIDLISLSICSSPTKKAGQHFGRFRSRQWESNRQFRDGHW